MVEIPHYCFVCLLGHKPVKKRLTAVFGPGHICHYCQEFHGMPAKIEITPSLETPSPVKPSPFPKGAKYIYKKKVKSPFTIKELRWKLSQS